FRTIFFLPSAIRFFTLSRRELLSSPRIIRPFKPSTDTPSTSLLVIFTLIARTSDTTIRSFFASLRVQISCSDARSSAASYLLFSLLYHPVCEASGFARPDPFSRRHHPETASSRRRVPYPRRR